MKKTALLRLAAGSVGTVLLVGVAGAAFADDDYGTDDVDVNVVITEAEEPGVLAMTVARVASPTSGSIAHRGASKKNGFSTAEGWASSRAPWPK